MFPVTLFNKYYDIIRAGLYYFVFAPECLECRALLHPDENYFCQACVSLFELINPLERCVHCFKEKDSMAIPACSNCRRVFHELAKIASACEYLGPSATMIRLMKYGNRPELASIAAAYMAVQWTALEWPLPDYIVPIPCNWLKKWDRGYNQAELIALELGKLLGIPVVKNLRRRVGDLSQAGLSREQRLAQPLNSFFVRGKRKLEGKTLLLIDDVMTTGRTMNACAEVLHTCFPKEIYGLTFCR